MYTCHISEGIAAHARHFDEERHNCFEGLFLKIEGLQKTWSQPRKQ